MTYHQQTTEKTIEKLGTSLKGLSAEEAGRRLTKYGPNELQEKKKKTALAMFLGQFTDFMILVLMAAAIISGFIGEPVDTIAIIVIVVLNAIIGFVQEYRAEQAMAALKKMAAPERFLLQRSFPGTLSFWKQGRSCPRTCGSLRPLISVSKKRR